MDLSKFENEATKRFAAELAVELFLRCNREGRTSPAEFVDDADNFAKYLQYRGFPLPNRLSVALKVGDAVYAEPIPSRS